MILYNKNGIVGYNPMLSFTHTLEGDMSYVLFPVSEGTHWRVIFTTVLSVSGFCVIAFSHHFDSVSAYGLLGAALLLCVSMYIFVQGLLKKRKIFTSKPKPVGRAPDIYAIEWFFNFAFAAFAVLMSANYFTSIWIKSALIICSSLPALMATIPFWGDRLFTAAQRNESD